MAKRTDLDRAVAAQKRAARKIKPGAPAPERQTARVRTTNLDAAIADQDGKLPIEAKKQQIAAELEDLFVETGDIACYDAARVLVPQDPNRPTINDDLAVRRMHALITRGFADNKHQAAKIVARDSYGQHSEEATIKRLMRKYTAFIRKLGVSS